VPPAFGLDDADSNLAVEGKRHREQRLERVALRATRRADIRFARRDAIGIIEDIANGIGSQSRPIVRDGDLAHFIICPV